MINMDLVRDVCYLDDKISNSTSAGWQTVSFCLFKPNKTGQWCHHDQNYREEWFQTDFQQLQWCECSLLQFLYQHLCDTMFVLDEYVLLCVCAGLSSGCTHCCPINNLPYSVCVCVFLIYACGYSSCMSLDLCATVNRLISGWMAAKGNGPPIMY